MKNVKFFICGIGCHAGSRIVNQKNSRVAYAMSCHVIGDLYNACTFVTSFDEHAMNFINEFHN